ncbi:MAG: glycoside hydrolase family 97 catalytic domain-containing protein [Armatimonadetes bacterium]|nr:glycoside hydrolase family 97 catalytic domain-containing protein [Armatimonadota bacterium]
MTALALCMLLTLDAAGSRPVASIASPQNRVRAELTLTPQGSLLWRVWYRDHPVLADSPLGLTVGADSFDSGLSLVGATPGIDGRERYALWTGPCRQVDSPWRQVTATLRNARGALLLIDLRVADGGVAVRYRLPAPPGYDGQPVAVAADHTGFAFTSGQAWLQPYHQPSDYTPAYEDYYQAVAIGQAPGRCRGPNPAAGWSFGGLYRLADGDAWALSVESGVDESWCGTHLSDGTDGVYRVRWPSAGEYKQKVPALLASSAAPLTTLPLTTAWRGLALAGEAGSIVTSTWPTDLAQPCEVTDPSWIAPGRASWSWLSQPERFDRRAFGTFLDFAAERGWEYELLDAGWWNVPLGEMAAAARERGVRLLLWGDSTEMYDVPDRRRRLDEAAAAGVAGFKIDFWCSDKQLAVRTMLDLCRDAAERRLVVVLHGCTIPRGWQRTWPNLLSAEAVLGEESYHFESDYGDRAAAHHAILPFTRNVIAPMDYTPALLDGAPWRHRVTAAHQLALPVLFTSGVQHHGGRADWYRALPDAALDLLGSVPAAWDESRCLAADPGRYVAVARRSGTTWFVAALNGTSAPLTLPLDLAWLGRGSLVTCLSDGPEGTLRVGHEVGAVSLAANGGYVLRTAATTSTP